MSRRVPSCSVMTSAARVAVTGPSGPSSRHSTSRAFPVRAAAASWLLTAARDGRSTNAVSALPVAYPGGAPIRSPARPFARRTVASASSTNKGTGAWANTARSRARSALSESAGGGRFSGGGFGQLGQHLDGGVELGEGGVEQGSRVGAGHRRGLAQRIAPLRQADEVGVGAIRPGVLRHFS